jgi:hypothetical protein
MDTMDKIYENLSDKHLNLDKIMNLSKDDKKIVIDLYNQLHDAINGESGTFGGIPLPSNLKVDLIRFNLIYNTLTEYGYLVTRREENLDKILG